MSTPFSATLRMHISAHLVYRGGRYARSTTGVRMTTAARAAALARALPASTAASPIELERRHGARNYDPLPVVLARGEGVWLFDADGRRYLDMMSAYSAVSFGHSNPELVRVLTEQAQRLAVTSRA